MRRFDFSGLLLACAVSLTLLVLSYSRILADFSSPVTDTTVLNSVLAGSIWDTQLARNIAVFGLSLLTLHLVFGTLCWGLARLTQQAFPRIDATRNQLVLVWSLFAAIWALIANAARFPHSSFGAPWMQLVRAEWLGVNVFTLYSTLFGAAVCCVLVLSAIKGFRALSPIQARVAVALVFVGASTAVLLPPEPPAEKSSRPHVIIIGIDSLRTDAVGSEIKDFSAPHIRDFLSKSVSFSDVTTPIARTFPSWVSILTGRHPHTTGATMNLLPRQLLHTGDTLADTFRREGYRTIYGIDEVRF